MNAFDYIGKLTESPYYEFMLETLHQLEGSRKSRKKLERMDAEIDRFTGKHSRFQTPDHRGFYDFASREYLQMDELDPQAVDSRAQLFFDSNMGELPDFVYVTCLYIKNHQDMIAFERSHPLQEGVTAPLSKADQQAYIQIYNKHKLLVGFLEKCERLVAVIINSVNVASREHLDEDLRDLDPHELKSRFLGAITRREKTEAFKLLGRLRDLDPGEEEYLEALAHFNNGDHRDVIRFASKVPESAVDYGAAVALKLESLAYLGDVDAFLEEMNRSISKISNLWHVIYLFQTILSVQKFHTMEQASNTFTTLMDAVDSMSQNTNFMAKKGDQRYAGLVRQNIAKAALELHTLFEEVSRHDDFESVPMSLNIRIAQLTMIVGLFIEPIPEFVTEFLDDNETSDQRKDKLVLFLLPFLIDNNPDKSFDNMALAMKSEYQLGFIEDFCDNVIKNLKAFSLYASSGEEAAAQLICLAYMERLTAGFDDDRSPDGLSLKAIAAEWMDPSADLSSQVKDRVIIDSLSSKGRQVYEAAEWQYRRSLDQDYGWKDAGMLSLAYYRIIELELNQKFVLPFLNQLRLSGLNVNQLFDDHLESMRQSGASNKKLKIYQNRWGKTLDSIKRVSNPNSTVTGLELGTLEYLFNNLKSDRIAEDPLTAALRPLLDPILTEEGFRALDEKRLVGIVDGEKRETYRNPPAHTKYLPYDIACECRDFVRSTILNWKVWWK